MGTILVPDVNVFNNRKGEGNEKNEKKRSGCFGTEYHRGAGKRCLLHMGSHKRLIMKELLHLVMAIGWALGLATCVGGFFLVLALGMSKLEGGGR